MEKTVSKRATQIAWLCTLVYFASYLTRNNFSVMLVSIVGATGASKSELATVITAMTVCYGLGQIINGFIGDIISPRNMLAAGLLLSAACNIAMSFSSAIWLMTVLWAINGYAQAMLWPPIVRLFADNLNELEYGYASVRVSCGSSLATVLLYIASPLMLKSTDWRRVMLIYALCGIAVAAVWLIATAKLSINTGDTQKRRTDKSGSADSAASKHSRLSPVTSLALAVIFIGIILMGILRDGVTNWMPSFLLESFGMSEEDAIFSTVILAIFSIISFYLFDLLHKRLIHNEVLCASVIFAGSTLSAALLWLISRVGTSVILSMLLMAFIVAGMHGVNLMLITVVPKRLKCTGRVSLYSGILNCGTYIGASVSTYGIAVLSEAKGWSTTILIWAIVAFLGFGVCALVAPSWKRFTDTSDD